MESHGVRAAEADDTPTSPEHGGVVRGQSQLDGRGKPPAVGASSFGSEDLAGPSGAQGPQHPRSSCPSRRARALVPVAERLESPCGPAALSGPGGRDTRERHEVDGIAHHEGDLVDASELGSSQERQRDLHIDPVRGGSVSIGPGRDHGVLMPRAGRHTVIHELGRGGPEVVPGRDRRPVATHPEPGERPIGGGGPPQRDGGHDSRAARGCARGGGGREAAGSLREHDVVAIQAHDPADEQSEDGRGSHHDRPDRTARSSDRRRGGTLHPGDASRVPAWPSTAK